MAVRIGRFGFFHRGKRRGTAPPRSVEDLAGVLQASDADGFRVIFYAFYEPLTRYALSLVDTRADAEDVVQGVFANVWCRRKSLAIESDSSAYLYPAVRNRCFDNLRQIQTRSRAQTVVDPAVGEMPPADREPIPARLMTAVEEAVAELPRRRREALVLRYMCELSEREVAELLGVGVATVHTHLRLGLKELRAKLRGERPEGWNGGVDG